MLTKFSFTYSQQKTKRAGNTFEIFKQYLCYFSPKSIPQSHIITIIYVFKA